MRFIGAGVIAVAAVWTLGTLIGPVVQGVKRSFGSLRPQGDARQRTEQDMAPRWILLVTLAMVVVLVITFAAFLAPT
ncbi:oligopeptide transporter, OPT family, partial [Acinetobacter baumannii]